MNRCDSLANVTIAGTNLTWTDVGATVVTNIATTATYLRPTTGGALLPWIYTAVILALHLPMVFIRVVRWEIIQIWCIVTALFSVIVYAQAFVSSQFDPAQILTWTPIILVIDAGSMAQVFFLVIEAKKVHVGDRILLVEGEGEAAERPTRGAAADAVHGQASPNTPALPESSSLVAHYRSFRERPRAEPALAAAELATLAPAAGPASQDDKDRGPHVAALPWRRDPAFYSALSAAVLFIAVVIMQIVGLVAAARAVNATSEPPLVSWCSPLFQPFGLAIMDGDCHVYSVSQAPGKGIGCIQLPGVWQRQWLTGTVVGLAFELVVELGDVLVLSLVSGSRRWKGVKLKRPWLTIFSGAIVLLVTLFYGVVYASGLPPKITEQVTVAMNEPAPASYTGILSSASLRGTIIGWNDGLFDSWGRVYLGGS